MISDIVAVRRADGPPGIPDPVAWTNSPVSGAFDFDRTVTGTLLDDLGSVEGVANDLDADALVECAKALGDSTRFRILEMLADGEHYAQEIVSRLDIAQSAVSRHLGLLERSGLVSVRPQRGMKYYSVSEKNVRRFAHTVASRLLTPDR